MNDRFKFRAVLKTDRFSILVEPFYILEECYFIDVNKAEVEFECKYPEVCFWDFIDEIKKQDYIQEIASDADLIITRDFTNLIQCTGLKDKNGKLIYEGDIIYSPSWWWGACFVHLNIGECGACKGDSVMSYILAKNIDNPLKGAIYNIWDGSEVEVIGNIYENKELLEEYKDE